MNRHVIFETEYTLIFQSEYTLIFQSEYTLIFQTEYTCSFYTGGQRPPRAPQARAPREFIYYFFSEKMEKTAIVVTLK